MSETRSAPRGESLLFAGTQLRASALGTINARARIFALLKEVLRSLTENLAAPKHPVRAIKNRPTLPIRHAISPYHSPRLPPCPGSRWPPVENGR